LKNLIKTLIFFISISIVNADTIVTTIETGNVLTGYFNGQNTLKVVVTFTGTNVDGGDDDKTEKFTELYIGWSSTSTVSSIDVNMNASPVSVGAQKASGEGGANDIIFIVTNAQLQAAHSDADGKYFKMGIKVDGVSVQVATSNADGSSTHRVDVTTPWVTHVTYPGNDSRGFNVQKITYRLNEAVIAGSYLRFQGDVNDMGAHDYNLAGGHLAGESYITIDPISLSSDLQEAARYDVQFFLKDVAGNERALYNVRTDNYFDSTKPRIASAGSSTNNDTYKVGDAINVELTFSESIFTDGSIRVTFETGGTDQTVDVGAFASYGSRVTTKSFTYTVQEGNITSDLAIKTIAMVSGDIIDLGYNSMDTYTFTGNNLDAVKDLDIDGVLPTVTSITSEKANGTYGLGEEIAVKATFSEAVTLSGGNFVITMETGATDRDVTISAISNATTATGTYTVQAGDASGDLTAASVSTTGQVKDAAGNAMDSFGIGTNLAASKALVIETTPPTVSNITSDKANGTYGVAETINVTVTFSEAVTLSGADATLSVPLETGDTDFTVEITAISNATTATGVYTVAVDHTTAGADLEAKSPLTLAGTIKDQAGNEIVTLAIPNGQNLDDLKNIKIDLR